MAISNKFIEKYGLATLEQFKENMVEGETEILYYRQILQATDYIPLKIFESFIEDMATSSLAETFIVVLRFFRDVKVTYADELEARKFARQEINRIESETATE